MSRSMLNADIANWESMKRTTLHKVWVAHIESAACWLLYELHIFHPKTIATLKRNLKLYSYNSSKVSALSLFYMIKIIF